MSDKRSRFVTCGLCDETYDPMNLEDLKRHEHPDPQSGPEREAFLKSRLSYERWIVETPEGKQWAVDRARRLEAKMDEPTIQRYRIAMQYRGASWGIMECNDGDLYKVSDVESYVAAQVEQARQEERKRCRRDEVKPLMDAIRDVQNRRPRTNVSIVALSDWEWQDILNAIAAVQKAQEEQP